MNLSPLRKVTLIAIVAAFSQLGHAQSADNAAALKQIADIVVTINHFPSDEDFAVLDAIIANGSLAQGVRDMANTVANIEHVANEEGRGAMEAIQENDAAPESAKILAGIIANINHTASDQAKSQLAELFP